MHRLIRNLITTEVHFPKLWSFGSLFSSILPAPEGYCRVETEHCGTLQPSYTVPVWINHTCPSCLMVMFMTCVISFKARLILLILRFDE